MFVFYWCHTFFFYQRPKFSQPFSLAYISNCEKYHIGYHMAFDLACLLFVSNTKITSLVKTWFLLYDKATKEILLRVTFFPDTLLYQMNC